MTYNPDRKTPPPPKKGKVFLPVFYPLYVTTTAIVLVLCLSANTSFAGFPRVCRVVAQDGYLPSWFAMRGRRLVYASGIYVLTALSGVLLLLFGGVTNRLIP